MKIQLKNVSKSFKSEHVIKNINIEFESNHIYGIVGRNGCGKSILFKLICGFLLPDSGQITIDGKILGSDIDFPESMGAIIEGPGFLWYQSGFENLNYLAGIKNKIAKKEIEDTMENVGLDPQSKKMVVKYSMGMKQRLNIAQAIMEDPDLIVLDEPMNGLDETGVKEMRELFLSLKNPKRLILLSSHNWEDIESICDTVFRLQNGVLNKIL